jgi:hypothetical protein
MRPRWSGRVAGTHSCANTSKWRSLMRAPIFDILLLDRFISILSCQSLLKLSVTDFGHNCKEFGTKLHFSFRAKSVCVFCSENQTHFTAQNDRAPTSPQVGDEPKERARRNRRCLKEIDRGRRIQAARYIRHAQADMKKRYKNAWACGSNMVSQ